MFSGTQIHICDVCRLVDFDASEKLCGYCPICDAWICQADINRWDRRLKAAYKRHIEPGFVGAPNSVEHTQEQLKLSEGTKQ